jgi:hypothetical protein
VLAMVTVLGNGIDAVGFPLASAPTRSVRLGMWESCSMAIIGLHAPMTPLIYIALREGGPTAIHGKRPQTGSGLNQFPDSRDPSSIRWRSHS